MSLDDALAALAAVSGGAVIDIAGVSLLPSVITLPDGAQAAALTLAVVTADVLSARLLATDLKLRRSDGRSTTWAGTIQGPRETSSPIQCHVTVQMPPELAAVLSPAAHPHGGRR
jgi:hypothetical protein